MVENFDTLAKKITDYILVMKDKNINIEKAYLFGSYAKGLANDNSDIDIALISKDFVGNRFDDRMTIAPLRWNIDLRIEPIPFRPEDFTGYDPLVNEIIKNGIEI
jgi:uncharacterized protein